MKNSGKNFHAVTSIVIAISLMVDVFITNNPLIIFSILIFCILTMMFNKEYNNIKKGFLYFIPFALVTIVINNIFVWQGNTVLFEVLGKAVTLENILNSFFLSIKILIIIYIFMLLDLIVDSDKAVSYFSSKMPKTTLMMLISLKLIPNMKLRIKNLREVYYMRGVNFKGKTIKEKIKSNLPVLSILLEDSLDTSFDIAESAYVRGFLTGKRSIYDNQKVKLDDYVLIFMSIVIMIYISGTSILKIGNVNVYSIENIYNSIENMHMLIINAAVIIFCVVLNFLIKKNKNYKSYIKGKEEFNEI